MKNNFLRKFINQATNSSQYRIPENKENQILLQARTVTYRYSPLQKPVIENLSFILNRGERKALIGKSGAGKSTLLKLLAGITLPESGHIERFSNVIGFMFQEPNLFPWLDVYHNTIMGIKFLKRKIDSEKIFQILDDLGIADLADRSVGQLSGGQKQRVALARTLLIEPDILLLDEPFTGIDPETSERLQSDIVTYTEKHNLGLLLVTHNYQEATFMANEIFKLESHVQSEVKDETITNTYLEPVAKTKLEKQEKALPLAWAS